MPEKVPRLDYIFDGVNTIKKLAETLSPVTDKISNHTYHLMYGTYLLPMIEKYHINNRKFKFLEIGLGCTMAYGPGASLQLWKKVLQGYDYDLWFAELNKGCVTSYADQSLFKDVNLLFGNQANPSILQSWVKISQGQFDVIIDDGGHRNAQILPSLQYLWPTITPGGLYFIEDLQVGKHRKFNHYTTTALSDIIEAWIEYLLIGRRFHDSMPPHVVSLLKSYPLPEDVDGIFCQYDACMLHKAEYSHTILV